MLSKEEKQLVQNWLRDAYRAAETFDGSEKSEQKLFTSLSLFEDFVRTYADSATDIEDVAPISEIEKQVSGMAFPTGPIKIPQTIDEHLNIAANFYERLKSQSLDKDIFEIIQNAGGIVLDSEGVFVKTDEGPLMATSSGSLTSYDVRTEPRLAILIAHLRNQGINGQSIFMDDIVITKGVNTPNMVRELPYHIVQIPRIDVEIAICDQIGQTTFVKKGNVGNEFWLHMSKEKLKERPDILAVNRHNDTQWWKDISSFISNGDSSPTIKVKVRSWANKPQKLDMDLIDESLLAHRRATGEWLSCQKIGENGKNGSYILEYGPYAGTIKVGALESALKRDNARGLKGESSISERNTAISDRYNLDYCNPLSQAQLKMSLIDESLLAHRLATGEWLIALKTGENGKKGSYVLEHGPYAGTIKVGALQAALVRDGARGLKGTSSIPERNEIVSEQHNLDYHNSRNQDLLDMDLIDESLLAHRLATGTWLKSNQKGEDGRASSYVLKHGPYAGKLTVATLNGALAQDGMRGLSGTSSIPERNAFLAQKHNLSFTNKSALEKLNMDIIDESLLAHRLATGNWLRCNDKGDDGSKGNYLLEHGPYAGKITARQLQSALYNEGARGLAGKSSIAIRNAIIAKQYDLDDKSKPTNTPDIDEFTL